MCVYNSVEQIIILPNKFFTQELTICHTIVQQRRNVIHINWVSELKWMQELTPQHSKPFTVSHQVCESLPLVLALIKFPCLAF